MRITDLANMDSTTHVFAIWPPIAMGEGAFYFLSFGSIKRYHLRGQLVCSSSFLHLQKQFLKVATPFMTTGSYSLQPWALDCPSLYSLNRVAGAWRHPWGSLSRGESPPLS